MGNEKSSRSCGDCTACCKPYPVPEIGKKSGVWCEFCDPGKGCGIYEKRPAECRDFRCMWLNGGVGGEDARPDKLGFIVDIVFTEDGEEHIVRFTELHSGVLKQEYARRLMASYLQVGFAVYRSFARGHDSILIRDGTLPCPRIISGALEKGLEVFAANLTYLSP